MSKNLRNTVIGAVAGTAAAGLLALPAQLPSAMANEEPMATLLKSKNDFFPPPFDTDGLYKPNTVTDDTVSQDVLNRSVIKKIEFGYTSYVTVIRTPTGVYSSDGLQSPNVRYPGISEVAPDEDEHAFGQLAIWDGDGWVSLDELDAQSFFGLQPATATAVVEDPGNTGVVPAFPISPVFEDEEDDEATVFIHPKVFFPGDDDEEEPGLPEEPEAPDEPDDEDDTQQGVIQFDPSIIEPPDDGPNAPDDVGPDDEGPTAEDPGDDDEDDEEEDADEVAINAAMVRI